MFSCVVGREDHCQQILLACMGSAHSVWTTLGLPQLTAPCAFWVYTAQAPVCSAKLLSKVGPAFCALPRSVAQVQFLKYLASAQTRLGVHFVPFPGLSSLGNKMRGKHSALAGLGVLITSLVLAIWFPGCAVRVSSQVCHVSPLRS